MDNLNATRRANAIDHLLATTPLASVQWYEEIDSTNLQARRLLLESASAVPCLLVADRQTAGRGRSDRSWWSPSGCLMMSLVLPQHSLPDNPASWPRLALVTGVALAKAIESFMATARVSSAGSATVNVELKWPNDVYLGGRKLAGVLVEAISQTDRSHPNHPSTSTTFVVGIGLNVDVDFSNAPAEIRARACSLSQFLPAVHGSPALPLEDVLVSIVESLLAEVQHWHGGDESWWPVWNEHSLLTGRTVELQIPGGTRLVGLCEGIDLTGQLLIRDTSGCHSIQSADVLGWS